MKQSFLFCTMLILGLIGITSCKVSKIPNEMLMGGNEHNIYTNHYNLPGLELAPGLTGYWEVVENSDTYTLKDSLSPTCQLAGELLGQYTLRWNVTNGKKEKYQDLRINIVGFTDSRDKEQYKVVRIGDQIWMAENLKATKYQNGDVILDGSNFNYISNESNSKYWFAYNNDSSKTDTFGRLYTWYAVTESRNICSEGWHMPTDSEWMELEQTLGMSKSAINSLEWRGITEGGKIAGNAELWAEGKLKNSIKFQSTDFMILPGGHSNNYSFLIMYKYAGFWTATELDSYTAYNRSLHYDTAAIYRNNHYPKSYGFSVRCVKD